MGRSAVVSGGVARQASVDVLEGRIGHSVRIVNVPSFGEKGVRH